MVPESRASGAPAALEVHALSVSFPVADHHGRDQPDRLRPVNNVSLTLKPGESLGLIGESGCGKTMTALAILKLVPYPGRQQAARIALTQRDGACADLAPLDPSGEVMRRVRGGQIGFVFQDAARSLSPVRTIGSQLREAIRAHRPVGRHDADRLALDLLREVGLPDPARCAAEYVHELSGGMSQRVAIALALCGDPRVLIADEPTTALDPVGQQQLVGLLRQLQRRFQLAVLFISHDLGLVEEACDEVAVMYLGRIVEYGATNAVLGRPLHPYTMRLLESMPRLGERRGRLPTLPGSVPTPLDRGACNFVARCDRSETSCHEAVPALVDMSPQHQVRCFLHSPTRERDVSGGGS